MERQRTSKGLAICAPLLQTNQAITTLIAEAKVVLQRDIPGGISIAWRVFCREVAWLSPVPTAMKQAVPGRLVPECIERRIVGVTLHRIPKQLASVFGKATERGGLLDVGYQSNAPCGWMDGM